MPLKDFCLLEVRNLSRSVRLGCTAEERATAQEVLFTIRFRFAKVPRGCETDRLEDSVCYAAVSEQITQVCESREFNLIESLCFEVENYIRARLPEHLRADTALQVEAVKVKPPVKGLNGGAAFIYSQLPIHGASEIF
jgi:7,8-dihydroneopterin aldolase/epimerase/oxygenase